VAAIAPQRDVHFNTAPQQLGVAGGAAVVWGGKANFGAVTNSAGPIRPIRPSSGLPKTYQSKTNYHHCSY
jgi:hypothetical protein